MKQLLAIALLLFSFSAFAFEADSVKTKPAKKTLTAEEQAKRSAINAKFQKFSKDRFAIDLIGSNWIYNKNDAGFKGLQTKWYSRGINIYFSYDFRIKHSRFSIAPGIGYSCSNIYHRHEQVVDSAGIHFEPLSDPSIYKVNKISLQYVDIPLEFRIKTNPDKLDNCWKFVFGFKAGIRVDAHTKQKIKDPTTKVYVERRFPDYNLFRMGPMIRIGYASFNITAYYGILGVFKKDRGPKANEFSVGISFNGL
ncbi:MAG: outer membrane beta-barrel protein [Chitinophagales bacterium]